MSVNKNPGSRDDNRGQHRGPELDVHTLEELDSGPSRDRDSDEYMSGGTARAAKERSKAELAGRPAPDIALEGHPNRVIGKRGNRKNKGGG